MLKLGYRHVHAVGALRMRSPVLPFRSFSRTVAPHLPKIEFTLAALYGAVPKKGVFSPSESFFHSPRLIKHGGKDPCRACDAQVQYCGRRRLRGELRTGLTDSFGSRRSLQANGVELGPGAG